MQWPGERRCAIHIPQSTFRVAPEIWNMLGDLLFPLCHCNTPGRVCMSLMRPIDGPRVGSDSIRVYQALRWRMMISAWRSANVTITSPHTHTLGRRSNGIASVRLVHQDATGSRISCTLHSTQDAQSAAPRFTGPEERLPGIVAHPLSFLGFITQHNMGGTRR
ncbi:hypothetical protein IQ07DRAFT_43422 [Pyrenochaeta sp. DS3sAY3a]|nr:hypothetical protein IQ07DRAFT_43422 [Pyrenochaeta sp. DS3sAY3a]